MLGNCLSFAFSNTHGVDVVEVRAMIERKLLKLFARRSVQLFLAGLSDI